VFIYFGIRGLDSRRRFGTGNGERKVLKLGHFGALIILIQDGVLRLHAVYLVFRDGKGREIDRWRVFPSTASVTQLAKQYLALHEGF